MKIYDSYTKSLREFVPIRPNRVVMYICGLTPYDHAHLGHARTYVAFDILKRYLIHKGYKIFHIQNITDIDDKLIKKAKETKQDPLEIAKYYHDQALEYFNMLNIIPADLYPKVSDHIEDIEKIILSLIEKGHAYRTSSGIYFDVTSFKNYGKLSKQTLEEINRHRIEPDPSKKNSADFALWKYTDDYVWKSVLGQGRPGWHIECSAMALKYSQGTLDIHGGAQDLIFPHHENEIAQSECYTGQKFANYWIHTGFLTVNGEKMSKSLGNFITIKDVLDKTNPMYVRMMFISSKYSSPLDYSDNLLNQAKNNYMTISEAYLKIRNLETKIAQDQDIKTNIETYIDKFYQEMDNDLNTPAALASLLELISYINRIEIDTVSKHILLKFFNDVLFIFGLKIDENSKVKLDKLLNNLSDFRNELRREKKYEYSDRLRKVIEDSGIKVYDSKDKTDYVY